MQDRQGMNESANQHTKMRQHLGIGSIHKANAPTLYSYQHSHPHSPVKQQHLLPNTHSRNTGRQQHEVLKRSFLEDLRRGPRSQSGFDTRARIHPPQQE